MNRSYSKIRHIQETNVLLEKKILSEQTGLAYGNEPAPIASVTDTENTQPTTQTTTTQVVDSQPKEEQPKEVDVQGKAKTEELVGTLQELLKNTYKQNIVVDKKYGPKTAQAILDALKTLKK